MEIRLNHTIDNNGVLCFEKYQTDKNLKRFM